jgi:lysozyme
MNLRALLEADEGRVRHAYQDSLGYWTIGVGHLIDKRLGGGLPDPIIDALLDYDIAEKTRELVAALPWVATLDEPRKATLISMAFQLGVPKLLKFRTALAHAAVGAWNEAADAFLDSKVAREQSPARWQRHARRLRTGVWE